MKKILITLILLLSIFTSLIGQKRQKDVVEYPLKNAADSLSYSFGILIGNNMVVQKVADLSSELFMTGFNHGYKAGDTLITLELANQIVQDYFNKQVQDEANMNLEKSAQFLVENKDKEGVITLPSGLQYKVLTPGSGEFPKETDKVKVHYTGMFIDGTVFDSSIERNEPVEFGVNQVIPGWTEGLQLMQPGARWMLFIPPPLAYGVKGAGGVIGPNQALIFEVELLEIIPSE